MYVDTKTRLMCDLMGPKLRLLFKCGFYTRLDGMLNTSTVKCGYTDNSRIATEFPCPEQSPFYLYACTYNETSGIRTLRE